MIFQYRKTRFKVPYHTDVTLIKVAILEFIFPFQATPVVIPGEILYCPERRHLNNLVHRDYGNYVRDNHDEITKLVTQIERI